MPPDEVADRPEFDPGKLQSYLQSTVVAVPLLQKMEDEPHQAHPVLITLHSDYGTPAEAAAVVRDIVRGVIGGEDSYDGQSVGRSVSQYISARLTADSIRAIVSKDRQETRQAIYQIWPDFEVLPLINKSASTVKADAARATFAALGSDIVWAVVDSGVDEKHNHFQTFGTLDLPQGLKHLDFTSEDGRPKEDGFGHGTHVGGIIAGAWANPAKADFQRDPVAIRAVRDEQGKTNYVKLDVGGFTGMAPKCKIVSYKALDDNGAGTTVAVIEALQHIHEVNRLGNKLKIHGVNLSVGYPIDPTWFACGQSPICVEVTRLVNSGVVVVAAAGNTGYGYHVDLKKGSVGAGQGQTINDPGNTDAAITVGSTHRDMPHTYGISYFSSKGPTGDGRAKPDLVAPGEKILSCAAGDVGAKIAGKAKVSAVDYVEDSGTSMAAAHVSGVIAAFLSIRREFIGQPTEVKRIFTSTATSLGRVSDFQGRGLIDLMRAIQSI